MRKQITYIIMFSILAGFGFAFADSTDIVPFARITATDTRDTFLTLWPRETDDAPYTIRDEVDQTSWKPLLAGEQVLTLDFAPLMSSMPCISTVESQWEVAPVGDVKVEVSYHCGSQIRETFNWIDVESALDIGSMSDEKVSGYCVRLILTDPGPAALSKLQIFCDDSESSDIDFQYIEKTENANDIMILFTPADHAASNIEIHYISQVGDPITNHTLVESIPPSLNLWRGPKPATDMKVAVVLMNQNGDSKFFKYFPAPAQKVVPLDSSGIVEGFYGRPWADHERRKIILRMAQKGLGLYIYAPKEDPLHRDQWRTQYDEESMARFAELRNLGEMLGVIFSFGISPGKDMDMESPTDQAMLIAKLSPFIDAGFRHFTLLLDDIEFEVSDPIDGVMGAKHTALANWLKNELSNLAAEDVTLWVVPTVYSDLHRTNHPDGDDYLDALALLDSRIQIMWTGTGVFSQHLQASDMIDVTSRIGRAPVLWDNEHATDGGDGFIGKLYLSPYEQRSADLVTAVSGIVANPMILGSANRLILGTYAEYLHDSTNYDPAAAQENAIESERLSDNYHSLLFDVAMANSGSGAYGIAAVALPFNPELEQNINAFKTALQSNDFDSIIQSGTELLITGAKMATIQSRMHHSNLDPYLVDDLWVPSDRSTHEGKALLYLLRWLGTNFNGKPDSAILKTVDEHLRNALGVRYQSSLFKVNFFRNYLEKQPVVQNHFKPLQIESPTPADESFSEWIFSIPSYVDNFLIFGIGDDAVRSGLNITWTPLHCGMYDIIIVASYANGWTFKEVTLQACPDVPMPKDDDSDDDDSDDDDYDDDDCYDGLTTKSCGC